MNSIAIYESVFKAFRDKNSLRTQVFALFNVDIGDWSGIDDNPKWEQWHRAVEKKFWLEVAPRLSEDPDWLQVRIMKADYELRKVRRKEREERDSMHCVGALDSDESMPVSVLRREAYMDTVARVEGHDISLQGDDRLEAKEKQLSVTERLRLAREGRVLKTKAEPRGLDIVD